MIVEMIFKAWMRPDVYVRISAPPEIATKIETAVRQAMNEFGNYEEV